MSLLSISDTLKNRMNQQNPLKKQIDAALVVEAAAKVMVKVFGDLSSQLKPLYLKNRTLTVSCGNSTLAQEIRLNQAKIVEQINKEIGRNEVDRIRYLS